VLTHGGWLDEAQRIGRARSASSMERALQVLPQSDVA
jgi:hypothetical protein